MLDQNDEKDSHESSISVKDQNTDHLMLEITVSDPEKKIQNAPLSKTQDVYICYLIESRIKNVLNDEYLEKETSTWHRYSEFEVLKNYLEVIYPFIMVPPIPEKKISYAWSKLSTDKLNDDFIERRRIGLENFLVRIAKHAVLSKDTIFLNFLSQNSSRWKESINATDYQNKAEWKLQLLSASFRLKNSDKQFESWKNYSNLLQSHLLNIIKIRTKIVDKLNNVHLLHEDFSQSIGDLASLDGVMQQALKQASLALHTFSQSIDSSLLEEELCVDGLKEYSSYCDSLRLLCRKQELSQLEIEKLEDALSHKEVLTQQLKSGNLNAFSLDGVKMRLFGFDNPDQKEEKIKQLESQIQEMKRKFEASKTKHTQATDEAKTEIDNFNVQKKQDINRMFEQFSNIQINRCKQNISVWQNIKDLFSNHE